MRMPRLRRTAVLFLAGCTAFSLVMFLGLNKSHHQRWMGGKTPAAIDGASRSGGWRFDALPLFQVKMRKGTTERQTEELVQMLVDNKYDTSNSPFNANNQNQNQTSQRGRNRRKMQRYLIEYSSFRDNEGLRKKFLSVVNRSSEANESVWFHSDRGDDGIVAQLDFIPRSYAKKMQLLRLMKYSKTHGWFEKKIKLDRYLKNELKTARNLERHDRVQILTPTKNVRNLDDSRLPDWNKLLKIIYLPEGIPSYNFIGRDSLSHEGCPVSACHLTDSPMFESIAHARVFQNIPMSAEQKPNGQIWVLWLLESPVNTFVINDFDMRINWTATFRWDSTIVTPYAKYVHGTTEKKSQNNSGRTKNYARGKSKLVAWFASNCFTTNNRMDYVKELSKYVTVDVYGTCGSLECQKESKEKCYEMLSTDYKFYLAFENSNCDSYITEKLFENAFGNNVVPVVMGARREDYERSSPPNSFIHVDDFDSAEKLAEYLKAVDRNDTLYNSYFAWKGQGRFIDTKFWCRLCSMLQDEDKPSVWYADVESWWKHHGTCRFGRWSR